VDHLTLARAELYRNIFLSLAPQSEPGEITAAVKGVKTVVNNITVTPPPAPVVVAPPPVINPDDVLTRSVRDAIKDFPGVTATVTNGVVTLTGTVSKENQRKIMMSVSSLKPKKIENKLTVK
jgi:osmotically-inducible protein OsmY